MLLTEKKATLVPKKIHGKKSCLPAHFLIENGRWDISKTKNGKKVGGQGGGNPARAPFIMRPHLKILKLFLKTQIAAIHSIYFRSG